jgi:hypothetical protein
VYIYMNVAGRCMTLARIREETGKKAMLLKLLAIVWGWLEEVWEERGRLGGKVQNRVARWRLVT